jgi:hypothetical protein
MKIPLATSSRGKRPVARSACKAERMELRLAPGAKQAIQRALAITGPDAGDLAYEAARRALDEHERRVPSGADRDAFSSHRVHHVGTGLAR